jgi:hypothetical protein
MVNTLAGLNPILQALLGTLFTWFLTALGAACVFFVKELNKKVLDSMLGFAAGVMIAASFWSLLAPAIEMAEGMGIPPVLPAAVGFVLGGVVLRSIDKLLPHLHAGLKVSDAEGVKTSWQRSILLVLAITIHNIPEGLAVGVAFGAVSYNILPWVSPSVQFRTIYLPHLLHLPWRSHWVLVYKISPKGLPFQCPSGVRVCPGARLSSGDSSQAWWSQWLVSWVPLQCLQQGPYSLTRSHLLQVP